MRRRKYGWLLKGALMTIHHVLWGYNAATFGEYLQNFGGDFFLLQDSSCPSRTSTHGVIPEKLNLHVTRCNESCALECHILFKLGLIS
jgi:hypothetical protein